MHPHIVLTMCLLRQLPVLVTLLLVGCASSPTARLNTPHPNDQAAVEHRINEIFDAAEKKDMPRLDSYHFYGPKFTKFAPEAPGRMDAGAARQGEHVGLSQLDELMMRADGLKVDVFGDTAIATFVMTYSFKLRDDTIRKQAFATLVFVKVGREWKITHEHFSQAKSNPS